VEFRCRFDGNEVFRAELFPAIAANPFISFFLKATASGELEFIWTDQQGESTRAVRSLQVV
jgi:sulfur-oxidizing protein SoxZ